jgi:hypothetical protein
LAKSFAALAGNLGVFALVLGVLAGVLAGMVQPVQSESCKGDCKGADEATKTKTTQGLGIRKNQFNFVSNNIL